MLIKQKYKHLFSQHFLKNFDNKNIFWSNVSNNITCRKAIITRTKTTFTNIIENNKTETETDTKTKTKSGANHNGKLFEDMTDLKDEYNITFESDNHNLIRFRNNNKKFVVTKRNKMLKYMKNKLNKNIINAHGCKCPDECFIDENNKNIFIIEKKFQKTNGSVCEKIQTPDFKKWQYVRLIPNYNIVYIYCLSDWFKNNCKAEIEYLNYKKIPFFWGESSKYKMNIVKYILNY